VAYCAGGASGVPASDAPAAADAPAESVVFGGRNVLAVRVRNGLGEAGIWKPVFIHAAP
jgi:hypothetical protein